MQYDSIYIEQMRQAERRAIRWIVISVIQWGIILALLYNRY